MANQKSTASTNSLPILSRLALSESELGALARQGFVSSENRGGGKIFRLRYRFDGQQHVRYVSASEVAALEAELALLQKWTRARRRRKRLAATIRQVLRLRRSALKAQSKSIVVATCEPETSER